MTANRSSREGPSPVTRQARSSSMPCGIVDENLRCDVSGTKAAVMTLLCNRAKKLVT